MKIFYILVTLCLSISYQYTCAQEEELGHEEDQYGQHQLGVMVGYAWVPNALYAEGETRTFAIPSIGIDYSYWIKHNYGLRLVNDLELSSYLVQQEDGEFLERNFKYIGAIVGIWEPLRHLAIYAGPGYEVETHESFFVIKVGAEIVKNFEEGWSTGLNASVDFNELYETVSAGFFIAKRF